MFRENTGLVRTKETTMNAITRMFVCALTAAVMLGFCGEAHAKCGKSTCGTNKGCSGGAQKSCGCAKAPKDGSIQLAAEDVWWGNKDVSFGNYIKFDRAKIVRPAPAPAPPAFDPIYFDLDKSILKPQGIEIAEKVLAYMVENPDQDALIEGHCCDLAPNDYNIRLGQRRADAVKKYLVDHGIEASRIATATYGEERRATTAKDERPLNRRAIVVIVVE
jgi:outer membrane protein OmpA-like peptidoglycan-associated protein